MNVILVLYAPRVSTLKVLFGKQLKYSIENYQLFIAAEVFQDYLSIFLNIKNSDVSHITQMNYLGSQVRGSYQMSNLGISLVMFCIDNK